ncbi:TPA: hypothetical protein HA273_04980 [Candidatus Bathyarchaeota archaeon]|nr:hypothetical protein [Candidatus Bathyarchaeota archaeon]
MKTKFKTLDLLPISVMAGLFVLVDLLAFLVAEPFDAAGGGAFPDPGNWFNIVFFISVLLVFTVVILLIIKFWKKEVIRIIFLGSTGFLSFYVFYLLLVGFVDPLVSLVISVAGAALLLVAMIKKPEWYVTNAIALFTAVGAIALIGISLTVPIAIVLLIAMAVYDALAVYKTKHMIDMADSFIDLKLPVVFVVPRKKGYSLLKQEKGLKEQIKEGTERGAYFLGVGDVVFPGILAVSAFHYLADNGLLMALSVLVGSLVGFLVLMTLVIKGKPQAGLPLLCSGAILGYVVAGFLLFGFPPF